MASSNDRAEHDPHLFDRRGLVAFCGLLPEPRPDILGLDFGQTKLAPAGEDVTPQDHLRGRVALEVRLGVGEMLVREGGVGRYGLPLLFLAGWIAAENDLRTQQRCFLAGLFERDLAVTADLVLPLSLMLIDVAKVVGFAAGRADFEDEAGRVSVPEIGLAFPRLALSGEARGGVEFYLGHDLVSL